MEVYFSKLAESKLIQISEYLLEEWNLKVKNNFIDKLKSKIQIISEQPMSCPESSEFPGLFKCVVTKHNTLYYRINTELNSIEVITLFDTRQTPTKLEDDL